MRHSSIKSVKETCAFQNMTKCCSLTRASIKTCVYIKFIQEKYTRIEHIVKMHLDNKT